MKNTVGFQKAKSKRGKRRREVIVGVAAMDGSNNNIRGSGFILKKIYKIFKREKGHQMFCCCQKTLDHWRIIKEEERRGEGTWSTSAPLGICQMGLGGVGMRLYSTKELVLSYT